MSTLTPAGELLDEKSALALFHNRDKLLPDQLPRAKEKLRAYRDAQVSAGEPLWPSAALEQRRQEEQIESLWLDQAPVPGAVETEEQGMVKEYGFLSLITKQPGHVVAQSPARLRKAVGDYLGDHAAGDSPEGIRKLAGSFLKKQRDTRYLIEGNGKTDEASKGINEGSLLQSAWNLARDGKTAVEGFATWQESAKSRPEWQSAQDAGLWEKFSKAHQRATGKWADYRTRADGVTKALEAATTDNSATLNTDAALPFVSGLTRNERNTVLALVKESAGAKDKGVGAKTGEAVGRVFARLAEGEDDTLQRLNAETSRFVEGQEVNTGMESDPAALVRDNMMSVLRAKAGGVSDGMAGAPNFGDLFKPKSKLTKDQADAANAENDRQREAIALRAELRDIGRGTVDPVKGSNWASDKLYYGSLNLASSVASFATSAGMALNWNAYVSEERNRLESLGVDPSTAANQALGVGSAQAGLDRLSLGLLAKLPAVSGIKKALTAPVASFAGAAAQRLPGAMGVAAGEALIEGTQQALPLLVQKTMAALGADEPDVEWSQIGKESWASTETTFFAMLPLAMLGLGVGSHRDYKNAREIVSNPQTLAGLGFDEDAVKFVTAGQDAEDSVRRLREVWNTRTPIVADPANPAAAATEASAAFTETANRGAAEVQQLQTDAGVTSLTRTDTGWRIESEDGAVEVSSPEEAVSIMKERGHEKAETFFDAIQEFAGVMKEGRTIELSDRVGTLLQEIMTADADGKEKTVTAIWDRADQFRASIGEEALARDMNDETSRNALEGLRVLGRSSTQAAENGARSISLILNGGGTLDLVEEQAENDLREAVAAGQVSMSTMRGMLKRIEAATGDKYIFTDTTVGVTEAWSSLVRLFTTGTRKDGNKITAGARKETAAQLRSMRRRLKEQEAQGVTPGAFSKLREYYEQTRAMLAQVARLMKAKSEGKLDELESMVRESVGLKEQDAHEAAVKEAVTEEYSLPEAEEDVGFAITTADRLDAISDTLAHFARDPEARFKMYESAAERLAGMARSVAYNDSVFPADSENAKRRDMLRFLQALDTILMPFPAEVRGKVGGFVKLAGLKTNAAMEKYIKERVATLDRVLEEYLRKEYVGEIEALIKKGSAKREAGNKPGGKLGAEGHALFDKVKAATSMTDKETDAAIITLSDAIEDARVNDPDAVPELADKLNAAVMFGALNSRERSARDLAKSLKWLQENYDRERTKWRTAEEARLAEVAVLADGGINDVGGKVGPSDRLNSTAKLGEFRAGGTSFSGAMRALFGKDSTLAARWTKAARKGIIQRSEEFRQLKQEWKTLKDGLYGKGWKGDRKLHDELVERKEKTGVKITDKMVVSRQTIPVSVAENILAGNAPDLAAKYSATEQAEMRAALDANILEKRPKDTITLTRISGSTAGNVITLSQGEAMRLSLMWRQPQGKRPMEANGYAEETMKEIEDFMSPNAKAVRDWFAKKYTSEWGPLNSVFAGMYGVNLPQIENYSPLTFWSQQRKELTNSDPMGGPVMPQGGMSTGMLKERMEQHGAEPRVVNEVDVFFDHMRKTAHFKAFAELAREMRGVMGKKEMRRALDTKHGEVGTQLIDKWMDAIEQGGLTQKPGWFEDTVAAMGGARAVAVLAWNFKSALTNSINLLGMARALPPSAYTKGLARLFSGQLNWWVGKGSIFQTSAIIQRRIDAGISPEMQAAMTRMNTMKPGALKAFAEAGMNLHAYSDAFFTSGSVAIAHDYHLRQFLADGVPAAEAERLAMEATEQTIADNTQPTEFLDRSTMEMERNALSRAVFAFMSDPRQKMAMMMEAGAEKDYKRLAKLIAIDHVVAGAIMAFIAASWRDLNDDDDGDWNSALGPLGFIDPIHWKVSDFLAAMAMGPWGAFPIFGPALQGGVSSLQGTPTSDSSLLGSIGSKGGSMFRSLQSAGDSDEPIESYIKKSKGLAIAFSTASGDPRAAVAVRVGSMAFDLVDNYVETQDEADAHELKMRRLEDKKQNPEKNKTPEEEQTEDREKKARQKRELEKLRRKQSE